MKLKRFTTQLVAAGLIAVPLMAHAAGLGKLSVTSALGQPLAAEIELFAADKAELDSLSANLASDQAFRDAHVEFAPVLSSLRFTVVKKPSGQAVLKVISSRPVNDPFIDLLVELNWASGRLVREYTMLLDPPGMASPQTVAPVAVTPTPAAMAKPAPAAAPQAPAAAPAEPSMPATPDAMRKPAPAPQSETPDRVTVKRGDTLTGIAGRVRQEGVSLEQTLVGLYRENTQAFDGNMNRLKAGKTLNVPPAEKVAAVPQQDAVREIKLQADDWRAYRQKLAAAVSAAPVTQAAPGQASSGKITPKVEDRAKPAPAAPQDVLKLSKVTPPAAATAGKADETRALQEKLRAQEEDSVAREKALRESNQRVALLEKQIQDMQKLVAMKEKEQAQNGAPAPAAPAAEVQAPEVPAPEAAAPAPKPVVPAPVVAAPPAVPEPTENWYDPLFANPMYWGGGLAALGLGGVLWWMMAGGGGRRRKTSGSALEDSIMTGGDVQPNTVIGAASGGSVNTGDTSFLTDFSQAGLGTIDTHDVDPIAEAEVYMAYGRDAQAEEILKEAINKNPDRHEIRVKLLEIYAARRNTATFEAVAGELYAALGSKSSPLWEKTCEMGRSIDPTNPLYGGVQSSAAPATAAATVAATTAVAGGALAFDTDTDQAEPVAPAEPALAFHAEPEPEPQAEPAIESAPLEFETPGHVLNFDTPPEPAAAPDSGYVEMDTQGLNFDLPDLDLPATADDDALTLDLGLEEDNGPDSKFDFSGLDLDLGEAGGNELELDEVGTKLDLARAYVEMGDKEGAREILNEVLAEGSDKQKDDAKGMLSSLG
jgi:pilus assembly protein FimV